jgi:DNA replication protein DnaC
LGVKAAEVGYSIRFLTLETMMTRLVKAKHENRLERALQQLAYPRLLIIVPGSPAALPPGAVGS